MRMFVVSHLMQKRPNWQSASEKDWEAERRREKPILPLVARGSAF